MDPRPPLFRDLPPWAWKGFALLLWLGILYQLGAWAWEQIFQP